MPRHGEPKDRSFTPVQPNGRHSHGAVYVTVYELSCLCTGNLGAKGGTIQFIMKDEVDMMPELRPEDRNVKTRILPE